MLFKGFFLEKLPQTLSRKKILNKFHKDTGFLKDQEVLPCEISVPNKLTEY